MCALFSTSVYFFCFLISIKNLLIAPSSSGSLIWPHCYARPGSYTSLIIMLNNNINYILIYNRFSIKQQLTVRLRIIVNNAPRSFSQYYYSIVLIF